MIRVLLIEQNRLWRSALSRIITKEKDIEVTELNRVTEAINKAAILGKTNVCIASIDQRSNHSNLSTVYKLSSIADYPVLVIADATMAGSIYEALGNYVQGFVSRNIEPDLLTVYIRKIANGERAIEPTLAVAAMCAEANPLTRTEREVLRAVMGGKTNKEIAAELHLAEGTVRNKLAKILHKTSSRTRVQAVQKAQEAGWV